MVRDRDRVGDLPENPTSLVGLSELMELERGSPDVSIALIDGPLALDHPNIQKENIRILDQRAGEACVNSGSNAGTHGTSVAGVLHARRDARVRGICPGCTLLARPIFSDAATVAQGDHVPKATVQELSAALHDVIEAGARIINLSIGLAQDVLYAQPAIRGALDRAIRHGSIVVAAAGNEGMLGGSAITRHPWVIPVVACDKTGHVHYHSNLGLSIGRNGLMAPGQDIPSLAASGGYSTFSGTSAAVPFVTGTLALLWSLFPRASATHIRLAVMGGGARRRSVTPPLLDAWAAHQALKSAYMGVRVQ